MRRPINNSTILMLVLLLTGCINEFAFAQDNWPQFRGTGALGIGTGHPPTDWNIETGKNILWKTPIDGLGHSGPVVWGNSVFLTTAVHESSAIGEETAKPTLETGWVGGTGDAAEDSGKWSWRVICIDRGTGEIRWNNTVATGEPAIKRHLKATHANCTPATDGQVVVAFFGSEGLYCFDFDGNLKWKKDLGRLHSGPYDMKELEWGFASSPVIHDGHVIVQCDCLNTGFVSILNLEDGEEVRRIAREDVATWSTPCVVNSGGTTQIVCNGFKEMASYDFETGNRIWTLSGGGDVPVPTPLFYDGRIFITNGHRRSPTYAISPDAAGDLTPAEDEELPPGLLWHQAKGGSYMPTPIIVDDLLYTCNDNGVLVVRETISGEQVYKRRVSSGGSSTYSASAVATKNHLFFSSEQGVVTVIRTGREYEFVSSNEMQSTVMATPALSGDNLFVRTVDHLVCIGEKPVDEADATDDGKDNE